MTLVLQCVETSALCYVRYLPVRSPILGAHFDTPEFLINMY